VPRDIRAMVIRQTAWLVLIGSAIGLVGGAALARLTSSLLYDVSANDPSTYVGVGVLLPLVGALAALAPVRRATRIDPVIALRTE
jgi:ABC-type antimicrobial peptide transport system permease subunit